MNDYYALTRKRFQDEEVADGYEERRFGTLKGKFLKHREEQIVSRILDGVGGGLSALDVPCGTGRFGPTLKRYTNLLMGADLSESMLRHSEKRGIYSELHHCEIENMPFANDDVDVIVCFRFIHHLPEADRKKAFREIYRVTRKYFIFSFNGRESIAYVINNLILRKEFYSLTMNQVRAELADYFVVRNVYRVLPFMAGETIVFCEKKEGAKYVHSP